MLQLFRRRMQMTVLRTNLQFWSAFSNGQNGLAFAWGRGCQACVSPLSPTTTRAADWTQTRWLEGCACKRPSNLSCFLDFLVVFCMFICTELEKGRWICEKSKWLTKVWSYFHKDKWAVHVCVCVMLIKYSQTSGRIHRTENNAYSCRARLAMVRVEGGSHDLLPKLLYCLNDSKYLRQRLLWAGNIWVGNVHGAWSSA